MLNFELLGPTMKQLHFEFVKIYYLMLPVLFTLSVTITWIKSPQGSIEFLDVLKRSIVSTIILVAFPDISKAILAVSDSIVARIDHINSLDAIIKMAQHKIEGYSFSAKSILLQFNNLILAVLSFTSYLILYGARFLTIAMYYFFWTLLIIAAPLMILFNMFAGTAHITKNLFKGLIEVASWKIVWAILGAMLTSISFGDAYQAEGNYLTLIIMNFVIALAMLMTPMLVHSIVGSGAHSISSAIGTAAVAAIAAGPHKVASVATSGKQALATLNQGRNFVSNKIMRFRNGSN